jgi:hypothetical protein
MSEMQYDDKRCRIATALPEVFVYSGKFVPEILLR